MKLPVNYDDLHPYKRKAVREEYIKIQKGRCAHCEELLTAPSKVTASINAALFPIGFFNHPVQLHHCHATGMTIGAVHSKCNAYLWQYFGK
jgi:hypothetical protein